MWPQEGQTIGISMPSYFRVCRVPGQPTRRRCAPRRTTASWSSRCSGISLGRCHPNRGAGQYDGLFEWAGYSCTPLLLGLTLHCRRLRVLDLKPIVRSAEPIWRAEAFRHDALAAELAGMMKRDRSLDVEVLIEHNARMR